MTNCKSGKTISARMSYIYTRRVHFFGADEKLAVFIPDNIKEVILAALDAEIDKLEKE